MKIIEVKGSSQGKLKCFVNKLEILDMNSFSIRPLTKVECVYKKQVETVSNRKRKRDERSFWRMPLEATLGISLRTMEQLVEERHDHIQNLHLMRKLLIVSDSNVVGLQGSCMELVEVYINWIRYSLLLTKRVQLFCTWNPIFISICYLLRNFN